MLSWSLIAISNKCFSQTSECAMDSVVNRIYFVVDQVLEQKFSFNSLYFDLWFSTL